MKSEYQLKSRNESMTLDLKVHINQLNNRDEKLKYIYACDNAYTISVLKRVDFPKLFDKIDKNAIFLGAEYEKERVGYAAFYANDLKNKIAYLTLICIADKYQRLHVGSVLMKKCIELSKKMGMNQIRLEVLKQDVHAILFYKSFGFEIEECENSVSYYMNKMI